MYNRYIPQPDGSYRKNKVADRAPVQASQPQRKPPVCTQEPAPVCAPPPKEAPPCNEQRPAFGAGDFLRRLLPKNLDTGDLLIIVLLLLMAGDCSDDKNTALLTLALYLFM